jgi:type I restriction enzyme S subunit
VNFRAGTEIAFVHACQLGDLLDFRNEIVHPRDNPKGSSIFVGLEHIERDTGVRIGAEHIDLSELTGRRARFYAGDIVYGYLRPYLNKVWIAEFDGICSVDQYVFVVRAGVDRDYVARFLRSDQFLRTAPIGSTPGQLPRIRSGEISATPIALPSLADQQRIAAILDKADAMRRMRKQTIALLDEMLRSIFCEMFGDLETNPKRFPTSDLENVVVAVVDCPHTTPNWTKSGKIALRTSNLTAGGWDWSDTRFVSESEFHERSFRAYVKPGDMILSREGTVGVVAIVSGDMEVCLGQRLVQIRLDGNSISAQYLLAFLLHQLAPKRISRIMVGATSTHLNLKDLRRMQVPVPPKFLQERYQRKAGLINALKSQALEAIVQLDRLFSSLQHRAFSGQL